jgi:hypothetical protein
MHVILLFAPSWVGLAQPFSLQPDMLRSGENMIEGVPNASLFKIDGDLIFLSGDNRIIAFDLGGHPEWRYNLEEGHVANFMPLPDQKMLFVFKIGEDIEDEILLLGYDGSLVAQYKTANTFLGLGKAQIRNMLPTRDAVFVNVWRPNDRLPNETRYLQEIFIEEAAASSPRVTKSSHGKFRSRVLTTGSLSLGFKNVFMVQLSGDPFFYMMDELEPHIYVFEKDENGNMEDRGFLPLQLQGTAPRSFSEFMNGNTPDRNSGVRWARSFTRITGFYSYEDRFVVVTENPSAKPSEFKTRVFLVERNGTIISVTEPLDQHLSIGVQDGIFYSFSLENEMVHRLELDQ